jgi:outer membrane protein assembly factor BamB
LWTFDPDSLSGDGESAYSQGTWFYGSRDHKVHAVDPSNGAERWATDITPEAQYMTRIFGVVVRGDTVIATTVRWVTRGSIPVKGDVVALNKITGKVLWRFTTQGDRGGFQGKALLTNRLAIVNDAYAHSLIGIDLVTGKEVWRTTNDQLGFINSETTPVLVGDTVYAASTDTQVYAVDANTGTILWRVVGDLNSLGSVDACPRFLIPLEFAGGKPFLIDRATHNVASTEAVGAGKIITSRFAVHGDMAYADGSGGVYAFRCN